MYCIFFVLDIMSYHYYSRDEIGVRLQRCTLMDDVIVKQHSWINSAIIGWRSVIGAWVSVWFKPNYEKSSLNLFNKILII